MTAKARQLGMRHTVFRNAHGLPDPEQMTTARDIATLSLALYDHFPRHARIFATRQFRYAGAVYRNHNTMLGSFEGMEGIKTGYTRASGFNLAASVRRNGRHVVAVVMGGRTAQARNAEMRKLLIRTLARASTRKSRHPIAMARAEPTPAARAMPQRALPRRRPTPQLVEPIRPATRPAFASNEPPIQMARVRTVPVGAAAWSDAIRPAAERPRYQYALPDDGRGARPSTLDAQAHRLGNGMPAIYAAQQSEPTTTAALQQPTTAPPSYLGANAMARGGFAVQVGAFATAAEAEARLHEVRQTAGNMLARATNLTEPVAQGPRTLYRARFAGLEAGPAAATCSALRRQRVDCFVTRLH
jgi:D-alanyl-D-alanine carboxypeptidase